MSHTFNFKKRESKADIQPPDDTFFLKIGAQPVDNSVVRRQSTAVLSVFEIECKFDERFKRFSERFPCIQFDLKMSIGTRLAFQAILVLRIAPIPRSFIRTPIRPCRILYWSRRCFFAAKNARFRCGFLCTFFFFFRKLLELAKSRLHGIVVRGLSQ